MLESALVARGSFGLRIYSYRSRTDGICGARSTLLWTALIGTHGIQHSEYSGKCVCTRVSACAQGSIGDCYFLAALANCAAREELIEDLIVEVSRTAAQ